MFGQVRAIEPGRHQIVATGRDMVELEVLFLLLDPAVVAALRPGGGLRERRARAGIQHGHQALADREGLELGEVLGKRGSRLSKGFRRRLVLAIALLAPQPYLFLDEPFDGFDLKQTIRVMDLLREVRASGKTLFLSIHQLKDAERACERLVLLKGTVHPYFFALLSIVGQLRTYF